jgi:hypothetical protein
VIDIYYYDFESRLIGTYDALSLGTDLTTLVLNGIGATTESLTTAAALAAASAGVVGANAAVNTDVFYKKTVPGLVAQMRASRGTALVTIKAGLKKSVADYSLDEALGDINTYYVAGTLPSAIAQITAKAGAEQSKADADLARLRNIPFGAAAPGSSSRRILVWLYPPNGSETNPIVGKNRDALNAWIAKSHAAWVDVPLEVWVRDKDAGSETVRKAIIKGLAIPEVK